MNTFRKTIIASLAAVAMLATGSIAAPSQAQASNLVGALIGGAIVGAVVGTVWCGNCAGHGDHRSILESRYPRR